MQPLSYHRACRSAHGGSIQIVIQTAQKSSSCEDFLAYVAQTCCLCESLIVVSKGDRFPSYPLWCSQFSQAPVSPCRGFPLFPYDNSHSGSQVFINSSKDIFHIPYSETVYPPPLALTFLSAANILSLLSILSSSSDIWICLLSLLFFAFSDS